MSKILVATCSLTGTGQRPGRRAAAEIGGLLDKAPLMSTTFTMREVEDGSYAPRLAAALHAAPDLKGEVRPMLLSPGAAG